MCNLNFIYARKYYKITHNAFLENFFRNPLAVTRGLKNTSDLHLQGVEDQQKSWQNLGKLTNFEKPQVKEVCMEEWVNLEEFPMYSVSNLGYVRMDKTGRILRYCIAGRGHVQVGLYKANDARQYKRYVSHLVAGAFVHNDNLRWHNTLIHLDGNFQNCRADNLRWRPRWFANKYAAQFRTMRTYQMPPIRDMETGEVYEDVWELIMKDGLLWNDIKSSISERTCVWPTQKFYEWVEK